MKSGLIIAWWIYTLVFLTCGSWLILLTHLPLDKMGAISQTVSWNAFHEWKISYFYSNFTEICSSGSNWQYNSIGSSNGLAPNRRQAITWFNGDPVHRHIYMALGADELTPKWHTIFHLHVWAMGCLLWLFFAENYPWYNRTILYESLCTTPLYCGLL